MKNDLEWMKRRRDLPQLGSEIYQGQCPKVRKSTIDDSHINKNL
jgi:hypothetical protein